MNDFEILCDVIDAAIMKEIKSEPLGIALGLFDYFDSPTKPLSPREFFHFWVNLTDDDKLYYISTVTSPLPAPALVRVVLLPVEIETILEWEK